MLHNSVGLLEIPSSGEVYRPLLFDAWFNQTHYYLIGRQVKLLFRRQFKRQSIIEWG